MLNRGNRLLTVLHKLHRRVAGTDALGRVGQTRERARDGRGIGQANERTQHANNNATNSSSTRGSGRMIT